MLVIESYSRRKRCCPYLGLAPPRTDHQRRDSRPFWVIHHLYCVVKLLFRYYPGRNHRLPGLQRICNAELCPGRTAAPCIESYGRDSNIIQTIRSWHSVKSPGVIQICPMSLKQCIYRQNYFSVQLSRHGLTCVMPLPGRLPDRQSWVNVTAIH